MQVVHAVAGRRPDGRGAGRNARLFRAAARLPVQQLSDAVNRGCTAVVPADAIAGVPGDCTPAMIRHTLASVATVATTDEVPACFTRSRGGLRRA